MNNNLVNLEESIGYKFNNNSLLSEALTHKSFDNNFNNERLEFLGDAVISLVVSELLITKEICKKLDSNELNWDDLLVSHTNGNSVIEYIDSEEQKLGMICMNEQSKQPQYNYTHCEIHPSTIFGILASCIPFPEHNQSPRNTYQCAMGKQAVGIYASNFNKRMDKTAYILNYPMKPIVETRIMNMLKISNLASGNQVIVAIMTHSGFNQEDSILFNKSSLDTS